VLSERRRPNQGIRKYLLFSLGGEEYGLDVSRVREVVAVTGVTRVPGAPEPVRGVMNLRGKLMAVMDIKRRLGLSAESSRPESFAIVVETETGDRTGLMGILVESVGKLVELDADNIEEVSLPAGRPGAGFLAGQIRTEGGPKKIIDIDALLRLGGAPEAAGGASGKEAG